MIENSGKIRFDSVCRAVAAEGLSGEGIGTMAEKRMHKALKRYICEDESCHEVRIKPDGSASTLDREKAESGRGGYIADIYEDGKIFEIQTAGFYPYTIFYKSWHFTIPSIAILIDFKIHINMFFDYTQKNYKNIVIFFCCFFFIMIRVKDF